MLALLLACQSNHPPEIVRLTLSPRALVPGEGVDLEVVAEVADPEGAFDLVAGWVDIAGTEASRFEQAGVPGTFVAIVSSGAVLARLDDGEGEVAVQAVFTDTEGNRAVAERAVTVACPDDEQWCDGRCVDPSSDAGHCGGCDEACGRFQACEAAACVGGPGWTDCARQTTADIDCDQTCAELGLACAVGCGVEEEFEDNWARYAEDAASCEGTGSGLVHLPQWGGGDCTVGASLEPPLWVSCCCRPP